MIIVDIETTGIDPKKHSIVSIGAVDLDNPENYFYGECKPRENALIDEVAIKINGFNQERINNIQKTCKELLIEFLEWSKPIKNKTIGGYNVHFDYNFLVEHLKLYNLDVPFMYRLVDLHSIFYYYCLKNKIEIPLRKDSSGLDLDFIIASLNMKKREGYHNALEDVKLTMEAMNMLINKKGMEKLNQIKTIKNDT